MAAKRNPGAHGLCAAGVGMPCHAEAAGTHNIARGAAHRHKRGKLYRVVPIGGEPFTLYAKGREAWALDRLREAGPEGVTPIEQPGPRWAAYVHALRARGVPIMTVREPHGGDYAGHHGRYILRADVQEGGADD